MSEISHTPPADTVARLTKLADEFDKSYATSGEQQCAADLRTLLAAYADAARDRERLDWLDTQCEAVASHDGTEHIANAWGVYAQKRDVRSAIDEARTGEAR